MVNIIGAGPAGLTAAIVLARHGYKARVYEMSPEVGHRMHGDFQGLENWSSTKDITVELREIGIGINFFCEPCYNVTVYAYGMKPIAIKSDKPIFYLVRRGSMRGTLDFGLKEQALSSGVEILFNRRIENFEREAIIATGPKRTDIMAIGITFETGMDNRVVIVFDDNIAPKGYAYLVVNQGYGTAATVLFREYKKGKEYFEKMMQFFRGKMGVEIRNEKRFGGIGNFFLSNTKVHQKKIHIGESGGFQDFFWGFGIRYAILSGYLAAKSFIEGSDYDMLWKKELKPMLETSLINRYLFEKLGNTGYRYLVKKFAKDNPYKYLRKHYNHSFFKHLFLPIARKWYESRQRD
jgi:flavin-dependent dehydrogenase